MPFTIRRLQVNDSGAYRQLRLEALKLYPAAYCSTHEDQKKLDKLFLEKAIIEENPDHRVYGAFDKDELIGLCGVSLRPQLDYLGVYLFQMVIVDAYQGQGVTRLLFDAIAGLFETPIRLELEVKMDNLKAIRAYESYGFYKVKCVGDEWVMVKEIGGN